MWLLKYKYNKVKDRGVTASLVHERRVETRELAQRMRETSHMLRESLSLAMLTNLADVVKNELLQNRTVHIDGLGTFSLQVKAEVVESPQAFRRNCHIQGFKVHFRADKHLLPNGNDDFKLEERG